MMKLGTETNSLTNAMLSGSIGAPEPVVGMGATILGWTDRHAATIVKVTPTQIHVQQDIAKRADKNGMSECQEYTYERDETAPIEVFRKTKRGYRKAGGGSSLRIGDRQEYHDYSF